MLVIHTQLVLFGDSFWESVSPLLPIPGGRPRGPPGQGDGPPRPAHREPRTFMPGAVGFPVAGFQVGGPAGLHQQVLHVPPGQLAAAMTQGQTAVNNADGRLGAFGAGAPGAGPEPGLEAAPAALCLGKGLVHRLSGKSGFQRVNPDMTQCRGRPETHSVKLCLRLSRVTRGVWPQREGCPHVDGECLRDS